MKFQVEQIAICPPDPAAAIALLTEMGAEEWARDHVKAAGEVRGEKAANEADLNFNYELLSNAREFEVLSYTKGANWMASVGPSASHLGMHCEEDELEDWARFFRERHIKIAQEVWTSEHTNPHIAGKRWYHYVIFNTRPILGIDVKFIVRRDNP